MLSAAGVVYAVNPISEGMLLSDAIRLTYRLPQRESYRYEAINVLQEKMTVANRELTTSTRTKLSLMLNIRESVLNSSTIDINYTGASILVSIVGMDSKSVSPVETELQNVAGKSSTITISPNGAIVSGTYDASDSNFQEVTSVLKPTGILTRIFTLFPASDVIPGSTWTEDLRDTAPAANGLGFVVTTGTVVLTFRGAFDTLGTRCWIIDAAADNLVQQGTYETGSLSVSLAGSGQVTGVALHDAHTGILLLSDFTLGTKTVMNFVRPMYTTIPVESFTHLSINQLREGAR